MVERFESLRHHAVVRGDDENDDVGDLRAAGPELSERLVPGRIQERDPAAVVRDLVGRDVLGDAAELALGEPGLADRVKQ